MEVRGKCKILKEFVQPYKLLWADGGANVPIFLDKLKGRIRKLTPKECWRLMGWKDEQFDKIQNISNTQLYKQAGNGIVVNVLEEIFKMLFYKNNE